MKSFTINENDSGQRLDKFITKTVRGLPTSLMYKFIRKKRIKVNGHRAEEKQKLEAGDLVEMYIPDEFFSSEAASVEYSKADIPLDVVYEDENLLLVNKKPGVLVHTGDEGDRNRAAEAERETLIFAIKSYLVSKGEYSPEDENSFAPALCNRIDRNTGGIVIAAKNAEALRILNDKIRDREIEKYYLCAVQGRPTPQSGRLENYLFKDAAKNQVYVKNKPEPGAKTAVTEYRVLASRGPLSLVECRLLTGRTHQIRAQMAHAGCPLLGDGKYGRERDNKRLGRTGGQALYSYKLAFPFPTEAGCLEGLRGKEWVIQDVDFVEEYFPGVKVD